MNYDIAVHIVCVYETYDKVELLHTKPGNSFTTIYFFKEGGMLFATPHKLIRKRKCYYASLINTSMEY